MNSEPRSRKWLLLALASSLVALSSAALIAASPPKPASLPPSADLRIIHDDLDNTVATDLAPMIQQRRQKIETFFNDRFQRDFAIELYFDRAAFDDYFRKRWQVPKTEPWMVASGVADRLAILSPRVWKTQAAEHDPADTNHVSELIAHELVHVFHAQHNPRPDFDGMDDLGWFVEGLATYASGQLDHSHRNDAREAIKSGKAPTRLADAWSGRYRYGVAGSMVEFVDQRHGRNIIRKLLAVVSNEEAMKLLNTTEPEFLAAWKTFVSTRS